MRVDGLNRKLTWICNCHPNWALHFRMWWFQLAVWPHPAAWRPRRRLKLLKQIPALFIIQKRIIEISVDSKSKLSEFKMMSGTHLHCADGCDDVLRSVVFYLPFYTFQKKMVGALLTSAFVSCFFLLAVVFTGEEETDSTNNKKIDFPSRTAFSFL